MKPRYLNELNVNSYVNRAAGFDVLKALEKTISTTNEGLLNQLYAHDDEFWLNCENDEFYPEVYTLTKAQKFKIYINPNNPYLRRFISISARRIYFGVHVHDGFSFMSALHDIYEGINNEFINAAFLASKYKNPSFKNSFSFSISKKFFQENHKYLLENFVRLSIGTVEFTKFFMRFKYNYEEAMAREKRTAERKKLRLKRQKEHDKLGKSMRAQRTREANKRKKKYAPKTSKKKTVKKKR